MCCWFSGVYGSYCSIVGGCCLFCGCSRFGVWFVTLIWWFILVLDFVCCCTISLVGGFNSVGHCIYVVFVCIDWLLVGCIVCLDFLVCFVCGCMHCWM